uniref:J domain-containing protein n=1 Tax=Oryza punctata TaxID=4537 RepID=A0A0E0LXP5_ORYPU
MICAPSVGIVFAPKPPAAAAVGYRPRKVRCAVAGIGGHGTLYDVLGIRAGATVREIKAAYRRLARERHPDVAGAAAAAGAGADDFVRLHDAYATLSDPDSRARYDRDVVVVASMARGAHQRTMTTTTPAAAPRWYGGASGRRPRRTWETDQCWI